MRTGVRSDGALVQVGRQGDAGLFADTQTASRVFNKRVLICNFAFSRLILGIAILDGPGRIALRVLWSLPPECGIGGCDRAFAGILTFQTGISPK